MISPQPEYINKYQVIKSLGAGNFGQVFHVFDRALHCEKAIKVILASDNEGFLKSLEEAQILKKCHHKHIVSINDANVFDVNGIPRVVLDLEYIPEGSLERALEERWVSAKESVKYIRGALLGLEHAGTYGFLHRDVKPGNILLAPNAAKLSDFGLATDAGSSLVGSANGYRPHLPPEYYSISLTNEQTDVYAVGVTLFRALSNIADWRAVIQATPNLAKHLQDGSLIERLGFEEFIPSSLKRVIRKACNPDPSKRFISASKFRQRLDVLRINIDWTRISEMHWRGYCGKKIHECFTDQESNKVIVTANGRRVRSACQSLKSLSAAVTYMHRHIATTTLQ